VRVDFRNAKVDCRNAKVDCHTVEIGEEPRYFVAGQTKPFFVTVLEPQVSI
jgi:hypothetical protein